MPVITFREALNAAMRNEMKRDENVILLGEDIAGGKGAGGQQDAWGGVLGATAGLYTEFGPDRVFDTPISESAFIGAAAGAAVTGLRPVAQLMFVTFFGVAGDALFNQMAKFRYMFGGKTKTPCVIRTLYGAGTGAASQHSDCYYPIFTHVPGLKVVVPSTPYEAKGLMISAIRDDDPVIFFEHQAMSGDKGEVPDGEYTVPFGEARVVREGKDATVVALGRMVQFAEKAAEELAQDGVECELLDPRTASPLDSDAILKSVKKTGRLVIVDESLPRCGLASDISAIISEQGFHTLKAPIRRVTPQHNHVPFAPNLEQAHIPSPEKIVEAVKSVTGGK
ncbi:pyruvate dehydrogenase E1 component beta subunit [Roseovarius pacificus]|uniref:Pyruvate dehydrogenase E1 component beta subunit n=1 Tax=Roseovarius pacificus TaxID=337701 RepID=A0A1M6YUF5_9RHOB|nr:alpha-ketoacid dehydrogenase subunit beta [Roseovarius pacificus]GGO50351.1 pyruvate dehydrogenase subunit beta [Roseovarius pacificus]SHL21941.1 pyruvate dehydrogenase E1 component beta subunit [Roseovarius pacificus]